MDFLAFQARLRPQALVIRDLTFHRQWTYLEWHQQVEHVAAWLLQQGIKQGDRVAVLSKNRAEILALHFACSRIGAIFVPLNWRLSDAELLQLYQDCQPAMLLADARGETLDVGFDGIDLLFGLAKAQKRKAKEKQEIDHNTPCLLLYTSGTTGTPKGVLHSETSLMETTLNMSLLAEVDCQSCFLCEAPMFHVIGLVTSIRPVLYQGGSLVISDGFVPERTLERLMDPALAISHYFCVPQMANTLRQQPNFEHRRLRHLKAVMTGGAPHPEVQIRAWLDDGIAIVDGYGMSEAGTVFGMPFSLTLIGEKAGYVGLPTHRLQVRLVDKQQKPVGTGKPGEVQLKGPGLMVGFWRNDDAFKAAFTDDGWFKTGDLAVQDSDGYFRIVDREKDMFISGGENVYPAEVEALLLKHAPILDCAVIGVPDETWGEVGCVFVVPKPGHHLNPDILAKVMDGILARYKLPKYVEIIKALPRNGSGKLLKHKLRKRLTLSQAC